MRELFIDIEKEKNEAVEIIKRKNLIVAYHGDHPNGAGVCTDGLAAAFIIKNINPTAITFAHSHYDDLAASKIRKIISNDYNFKTNQISTVMFSDTTISKNKFEEFLIYLKEMIPTEINKFHGAKLNIVFQDHHLGPMEKVINQVSNFYKTINDLPEKLTEERLIIFQYIQKLIKCEKLFFTKISSKKCEANKQPSSELLFEIINPLVNLKEEQLFFVLSCILSEKVSIFPPNDKSVKQAFENFKLLIQRNFNFNLKDNEIIDFLDFLDNELSNLAKAIDLKLPFTCTMETYNSLIDYSMNLMNKIINTSFLKNLYSCVQKGNIIVSQKRLKVENSQDELILLPIKDKKYFIVTPFPRQSITRSLTFIMQKVRDIIQKQENIEIEAFLLPNFSTVVSVIPYNDEIYCKLNEPKSYESQALPIANFIRVGHVNAFVLKSSDSKTNYSSDFKKYLKINKEQFKRIKGISNFLNENKKYEINSIDLQSQYSTSEYYNKPSTSKSPQI